MNHGLTLIISLFYLVQTSFKECGEVGLSIHLGYIRFTKTGRGPWLRGVVNCLGPAGVINCTPLSICIVLLSEFVSWNRGYNTMIAKVSIFVFA